MGQVRAEKVTGAPEGLAELPGNSVWSLSPFLGFVFS